MTGKPTLRLSVASFAVPLSLVVVALSLSLFGFESQTAKFVVGTVIVIAVAGIAFWAWRRANEQQREYREAVAAWTAREAVRNERLRIAIDLHDLASHGLGSITMRAASARLTPDRAGMEEALFDIEQTSRHATTELRRMLALLWDSSAHQASLTPLQSLADLPRIIDQGRSEGLEIQEQIDPEIRTSSGTELAICAVVSEGLANVRRHAGSTSVEVLIQNQDGTIIVEIVDSGPSPTWTPVSGAGFGLIGLQERVQNLGGKLIAGQKAIGFSLRAMIPAENADD